MRLTRALFFAGQLAGPTDPKNGGYGTKMSFSEALKSKVRRRAHFCCCLCKALGVEVHHVIPQEEVGPDTEENAAPLCPTCHETYGANPTKRKFIREARDLWYEICERRYASAPDRLDELRDLLKNTVSYEAFEQFKEELFSHLADERETPRPEEEIVAAIDELFDRVWYNRHKVLCEKIEDGVVRILDAGTYDQSPDKYQHIREDIWAGAQKSAKRVEMQYGKKTLGPMSDFDWGMMNGKLSALRWVLGDEWDMLDT